MPERATDAEALFVRAVWELGSATASHDWYVLLKTSAPLRLLLLDGLLHNANQRHGLKMTFRVSRDDDPPPIEVDRHWNSVAPHGRPVEHTMIVGLGAFLQLKVFIRQQVISLSEMYSRGRERRWRSAFRQAAKPRGTTAA